jgi:stress-induced morphogen
MRMEMKAVRAVGVGAVRVMKVRMQRVGVDGQSRLVHYVRTIGGAVGVGGTGATGGTGVTGDTDVAGFSSVLGVACPGRRDSDGRNRDCNGIGCVRGLHSLSAPRDFGCCPYCSSVRNGCKCGVRSMLACGSSRQLSHTVPSYMKSEMAERENAKIPPPLTPSPGLTLLHRGEREARLIVSLNDYFGNDLQFCEVWNESDKHNVPKGSETHFKVVVVSPRFKGKKLVDRHRMINEALKDELSSGVHALSITALTPSKFDSHDPAILLERATPACLGGSKK